MPAHPIALGDMCFYWRMRSPRQAAHPRIPSKLPFGFSCREDLALIIQSRNPTVLRYLEEVYREDQNVGYLQTGHALSASYGGDFLAFIDRTCAEYLRKPRRFVEIGCGGAYLLERLRSQGHDVLGIDPSPAASRAASTQKIEVIADFYPTRAPIEAADVVFHYDVLEHVEDPVAFLRAHHDHLAVDGRLILAVPDCSAPIACGDASMALHEHLNYFDQESVTRTLHAAGFDPICIEKSGHGGVLYAVARRGDAGRGAMPVPGNMKFATFSAGLTQFSAAIRAFVARHAAAGGVGIYVPLRLMPYLAGIPDTTGVRFFDDDPGMHGRLFDGYDIAVENLSDLATNPPAAVLIASFSFADRIHARIRGRVGNDLVVRALRDFAGTRVAHA